MNFEALYRSDPDPWQYETSSYERDKYAATLEACGAGPHRRALELGGSIGVFTALLAPSCIHLVSIDGSETAVGHARHRLSDLPCVDLRVGDIPEAMEHLGTFDLIVASEVLYYLDGKALNGTLAQIEASLRPGGRLVAVHWAKHGPERPFTAEEVHDRLRACRGLTAHHDDHSPSYLLDVFTRSDG